jgi:hypothetical protein
MKKGDKHFEVVKEFVYLGSLITPTNDVSLGIQQRIQNANRCFFGLRKHAVKPLLTPDKIHHSQDLDPPSPALWQWDVGADQKGGEPIARIWEEGFPNDMQPKIENGVYRRRYNHKLDKEFDSPNALNVTKTSRLRYAGHIISRPEDLPQKTLCRAKLNGRRNQGRPVGGWVKSDSLALGVRDWTHCAQHRQTWRELLQQALTRYWL